jgi:hypothetical protein
MHYARKVLPPGKEPPSNRGFVSARRGDEKDAEADTDTDVNPNPHM